VSLMMRTFMRFFKIFRLPDYNRRTGKSIARRAALLSWFITMITLAVFVLVTIPQQKKNFINSLISNANGVAVSLHEVAAGAAINEDFASVVSAAQIMLAGNPDLDFLIVMKNTGFSLIIEQNGWRADPDINAYWLPQERKPRSGIETVPLFNRRVFHFAQPFDYSGIQWGWIHVGLSLKGYDQSVKTLYRNTVILAVGCLLFSFLISFIYAAWLVRPILNLRGIVEKLAGGNFFVRAKMTRQDELGNLAASVNTMADALQKRDRILESVRFAAQQFMQSSHWEDTIESVLAKIGLSAEVGRVLIFTSNKDDAGRLTIDRQYEWVAKDIVSKSVHLDVQKSFYDDSGWRRWGEMLRQNHIVSGPVSDINTDVRTFFEDQDIHSIIAIPIFVEEIWWGFMALEDLIQERVWSDAEKDSLSAGADILGVTIARQQIQDALLESKATLEKRVQERTRELKSQVTAKKHALKELAAAQSSLVEMSRSAGMAEVATGVLHNVGNVLNSVNVSCDLIMNQIRESRVVNIAKLADLISANSPDRLGQFLTEDPQGRQIPAYLVSLSPVLKKEQQLIVNETEVLHQRIGHIKEIVTMQQTYGRVSGFLETIAPEQLMEDALKINTGALARHEITAHRQYQEVPPITVDKHQVLQILLNLVNNAKYACAGMEKEKIITLGIFPSGPDRLSFQVSDNGTSILPENLTRIFQHGFTTRKTGHGFGLHNGAIAAKGLGGSLTVHSQGPGLGATFTLELPFHSGDTDNDEDGTAERSVRA